jgi:hypothetical protein
VTVRYWHGGMPGLNPGDWILPPRETGSKSGLLADLDEAGIEASAEVRRDDVVYLASDITAAVMFGALYPGGGWVYEVEPTEPLEPDPDCDDPTLSFRCPRAQVLVGRPISADEKAEVVAAFQ